MTFLESWDKSAQDRHIFARKIWILIMYYLFLFTCIRSIAQETHPPPTRHYQSSNTYMTFKTPLMLYLICSNVALICSTLAIYLSPIIAIDKAANVILPCAFPSWRPPSHKTESTDPRHPYIWPCQSTPNLAPNNRRHLKHALCRKPRLTGSKAPRGGRRVKSYSSAYHAHYLH